MVALGIDEAGLAARLSVNVTLIYSWLAGKDPKLPHLVQNGIVHLLNISGDIVDMQALAVQELTILNAQGDGMEGKSIKRAWRELSAIYRAQKEQQKHRRIWESITSQISLYHGLIYEEPARASGTSERTIGGQPPTPTG